MANNIGLRKKRLLLAAAVGMALTAGLMALPQAIAQPAGTARTTPSPGTEAALRHQIEAWENKQPAVDAMVPALANATTQQQARFQQTIDDWGALKSIAFKSVNLQGWDVYAVAFANAQSVWQIAPLTPDGKIGAMNFVKAIPRDGTNMPSPGTEAALRRHIDGLQNGKPDYDILAPALANATRAQLGGIVQNFSPLGGLKALTFQNVNPQGFDVYDAAYENGHATWGVAPLIDGKIDGLMMVPPRIDAPGSNNAAAQSGAGQDPVKAYIARTAAAQQIVSDSQVATHAAALFNDPGSAVLGNPNGDVTIVEFFEYNCPFSRAVEPRLQALLKADPGVRLVLKEFTIEPVESSPPAARAALASVAQGKYKAFHDLMMRITGHTLTVAEVYDDAKLAGLDVERLEKDMEAPAIYSQIIANFNLARGVRIFETPTFIIGGHIITDPSASIDFPKLVAGARAKKT